MNDHTRKLLFDVLESARGTRGWCQHRTFAEYEADRQFRRAVEREFEIIGEALNRLLHADPTTAASVTQLSRIIGIRNRIIHGYDTVDGAAVCGIMERDLPRLLGEVEAILQEPDGDISGPT